MRNDLCATLGNIPEPLITAALPESMSELLRAIPLQVLLMIADQYGGGALYIPLHPQPDEGLGKLIGMGHAKALSSLCGGCSLEVPRLAKLQQLSRNAAVRDSISRGMSKRDTARAFGLTTRHVHNICNAN